MPEAIIMLFLADQGDENLPEAAQKFLSPPRKTVTTPNLQIFSSSATTWSTKSLS